MFLLYSRKFFMEKGSLRAMIDYGFLNQVRKVADSLGEKDAADKILLLEPIPVDSIAPRNGLQSALKNDLNGLGRQFIRLLKDNQSHISESLWTKGITDTVRFFIARLDLEVVKELVEELELDADFFSSSSNTGYNNSLFIIIRNVIFGHRGMIIFNNFNFIDQAFDVRTVHHHQDRLKIRNSKCLFIA